MTNWRLAGHGVAGAALLWMGLAGEVRETRAAGAEQPRRAFSGDLTKPIDQYTGQEFFTLTNGLSYGAASPSRTRRCRGNAACTGPNPTRTTTAIVWEVSDADSVSAGQLLANGAVVARARVTGQDSTDMYRMAPNQGRFDYFLIVIPAAGNTATWRLEEMETRQPGNQRFHKTVATGRFNLCGHPFQRGARADFQTCAQAGGGGQGGSAQRGGRQSSGRQAVMRWPASFRSLTSVLQDGEPPLWIGCASGCCTAEG